MKILPSLFVALYCVGAALGPRAWSQNIYKCGNSYSQTACPGAVVVDTGDSRTPAQKAQTDAAAAQSARSADKLEQERLALEKRPSLKASRSDPARKADKAEHPTATASTRQKGKPPEYFTAAVMPGTKKDKKAARKSAEATQTSSPEKTAGP